MFDESIAKGALTAAFKRYTAQNPFKPGDFVQSAPGQVVTINGQKPGIMLVLEKTIKTDDDRCNVRVAGLMRDGDDLKLALDGSNTGP